MNRLKQLWLWAFAAVAISLATAQDVAVTQTDIENRLRGEWVGVAGHWGTENPPPSARRFVFRASNHVEVVIGKERVVGKYRINVSENPYRIDFTFETDGKTITTLTIFDFPTTNQLRMAEWDPAFRRDRFRPGITFEKGQASNHTSDGIRQPADGLPKASR